MDRATRYHHIVRWFQNHKVFSWVAFAVLIVVGAGSLTGAIDTIVSVYTKYLTRSSAPMVEINSDAILPIPKVSHGYLYDVQGQALEALSLHPDTLVKTEVDCPEITDLRCPLFTDDIVHSF